jgi:hypothetical protein
MASFASGIERRGFSFVFKVFMGEDCIEDSFHAGSMGEDAHGPDSSDSVCSSDSVLTPLGIFAIRDINTNQRGAK